MSEIVSPVTLDAVMKRVRRDPDFKCEAQRRVVTLWTFTIAGKAFGPYDHAGLDKVLHLAKALEPYERLL
jgi:hypothetical protein